MPRPGTGPVETSARARHFVVSGYAVERGRVLLLFHRKLKRWLPPGGHVEPTEHPLQALVREFREETGLEVIPYPPAPTGGDEADVRVLPPPHHLQLERIDEAHDHVDLVYFCRIVGGKLRRNEESEEMRWFSRPALTSPALPPNVVRFAREALERGPPGTRSPRSRRPFSSGSASTRVPGPARAERRTGLPSNRA